MYVSNPNFGSTLVAVLEPKGSQMWNQLGLITEVLPDDQKGAKQWFLEGWVMAMVGRNLEREFVVTCLTIQVLRC